MCCGGWTYNAATPQISNHWGAQTVRNDRWGLSQGFRFFVERSGLAHINVNFDMSGS